MIIFYFQPFGSFSQVFGQVKELDILELHEIIRVSHLAACPVFFIGYSCKQLTFGFVVSVTLEY